MARLPLAFECDLVWADLKGDARERHCTACNDRVVNLSAMTRREAETFLRTASDTCVRYTTDAEGEMTFAPAPHRLAPRSRRLALALALPLAACESQSSVQIDLSPASQPLTADPDCTDAAPVATSATPSLPVREHREHMGKPPSHTQPMFADKARGRLIVATPGRPDTTIWIDGKDSKRVAPVPPNDPLVLKPGKHTISLRFADGQRLERTIDVHADETFKLIER